MTLPTSLWNWRSAARTVIVLLIVSPLAPLLGVFSSIPFWYSSADSFAVLVVFAVPMGLAAVAARLTGHRAGGMAVYAAVAAMSVIGWAMAALSQMQFD